MLTDNNAHRPRWPVVDRRSRHVFMDRRRLRLRRRSLWVVSRRSTSGVLSGEKARLGLFVSLLRVTSECRNSAKHLNSFLVISFCLLHVMEIQIPMKKWAEWSCLAHNVTIKIHQSPSVCWLTWKIMLIYCLGLHIRLSIYLQAPCYNTVVFKDLLPGHPSDPA